jgi:NAD+ synthase
VGLADLISGWMQAYARAAGAEGFVFGLSGGVDSAVAGGLAVRAVGPERTLAALMPCQSQPIDAELGQLVADEFAIPTVTVDLTATFEALADTLPPTGSALAAANLKPRLRMSALYYLATSRNYLVLGSGNKTELAVGYFTKHGDGGVDLLPLGDLDKRQVWALATEIGVPQIVIDRPPTAGLWPGQTDEAELGITYLELDRVLFAIGAEDTAGIDPAVVAKVEGMVARSDHKRALPPIFKVSRPE